MPRKALYDLDFVLTHAADVFLEHGYHGAVLDELIARTDFNRRAFYIEFTDKKAFHLKVVQHYQQQVLNPIIAQLYENRGLVSISAFFDKYIALVKGHGCLLINAITELGFDDEVIRDLGRHYLDELQIAFIGCLEKAKQHGEVRPGVSVEGTALQFTNCVQGFAVNGILASSTDELEIALESLVSPLLPND